MSGLDDIVFAPAAITGFAAAGVGFAVFWANPRRAMNRVFFSASLHAAAWLFCRELAAAGGPVGQRWLRVTTALAAFLPPQLWLIKETIIVGGKERLLSIVRRGQWWWLVSLLIALLCFTQWFVPTQVDEQIPRFRSGFYVYIAASAAVYAFLCREVVLQLRAQTGGSRLELQIVLLGGSGAALLVIFLMGLRAVTDAPWIHHLQPLVVLSFFTATAIAITTSRILDARQIIYGALQKIALLAIVVTFAYVFFALLSSVAPTAFSFVFTAAMSLWIAFGAKTLLDRAFRFYPQAIRARQAALAAAQRETRVETLERAFKAVLSGWGQTENTLILSGKKELMTGGDIQLAGDSLVSSALFRLRWATPERLNRERRSSDSLALEQFLEKHSLGLLVVEDGPTLTTVIGVGYGTARRPYTYPQVVQLMELASIMENALERAHFSAKVQHTEQLATVGLLGASLAHEIRNPLVSIKTFVQLLPTHYQDARFRDKFFKLIGDEVGRIDQLTEQLLDLSSPRAYAAEPIDLHAILRASLDLVAAKAADKNIEFVTEFNAAPDRAFTDASAVKQVILNLCFNAIQAVDASQSEARWVKIATRNIGRGIEMAVADSGPGIAQEIRAKLFQPFQTTKSTGFGLGLAICSDILANLSASISVDPPKPGAGATFRVTFPCQPL